MGKYTGVKSKFIKEKIKKAKWKDRDYIDELIMLEEEILYVMFEKDGGDKMLSNLMKRNPEEYKVIYTELKPKNNKDFRKRKKEAEKKEDEFWKREFRKIDREEKQDKKNWIKAGGKK